MYDEEIEKSVRQKVKAKKGFMTHFAIYCAFVVFFFLLNIMTSGLDTLWFIWPSLVWGFGVCIYYISVFGFPGSDRLVEQWEIEETAKELRRRREANREALPEVIDDDANDHLDLPTLEREEKKRYEEDDFV